MLTELNAQRHAVSFYLCSSQKSSPSNYGERRGFCHHHDLTQQGRPPVFLERRELFRKQKVKCRMRMELCRVPEDIHHPYSLRKKVMWTNLHQKRMKNSCFMRSVKATRQRPVLWGIPVTLRTALCWLWKWTSLGLLVAFITASAFSFPKPFPLSTPPLFIILFPERTQNHLAFSHPFQQLKGKL